MNFVEFCKTAICKQLLLKDTCFIQWNYHQIKIVANFNPVMSPIKIRNDSAEFQFKSSIFRKSQGRHKGYDFNMTSRGQ